MTTGRSIRIYAVQNMEYQSLGKTYWKQALVGLLLLQFPELASIESQLNLLEELALLPSSYSPRNVETEPMPFSPAEKTLESCEDLPVKL